MESGEAAAPGSARGSAILAANVVLGAFVPATFADVTSDAAKELEIMDRMIVMGGARGA